MAPMPADAPVMRAVPFVVVLMDVLLRCPTPRAFRNLTIYGKVGSYLSKKWKRADGSPGIDVHLPGGGRNWQPVGCGAAIENPAGNGQPQGLRARVPSADEAVQPLEPQARLDRCGQFLLRRVQTDPG